MRRGCCQICGELPGCVLGVFVAGGQGPDAAVVTRGKPCGRAGQPPCMKKDWKQGKCHTKDAAEAKQPRSAAWATACTPRRTTSGTGGLSLPASVPGDLVSDLQRAGMVGDPLFEDNFLNGTRTWNLPRWDYVKHFTLAPALEQAHAAGHSVVLVLDGVKMGASVSLNGHSLGVVTDQFLRYEFPLPAAALQAARGPGDGAGHAAGVHELRVEFSAGIACGGRWMACTGGWDWAPYTYTTQEGALTFSKGLWKSVYLATVGGAAITHLVPHVFYLGDYPAAPLLDGPGKHAGFELRATVHLWAPRPCSGTVAVAGEWGSPALPAAAEQAVELKAGDNKVTLRITASAGAIKLWWPNGMGEQPLYSVNASFDSTVPGDSTMTRVTASRRVGFRFVALVTGDDSDPAYVARSKGQQGTDHLGMLFRVNGAPMFARGANMIPMDELEGRLDAEAHRVLVRSAQAAHFNIFRFWGGGMFLPDAWYDECDKRGIMVYHDMQYAQHGHSPAETPVEEAELRYQIRRLSSHPSIVMWDGCNECQVLLGTPTGIYASFVMTVVAEEDSSRALWPSCPARGWAAGVDKLTSRPVCSGEAGTVGRCAQLVPHPLSARVLEQHGPYQHGDGMPAVDNRWPGNYTSPQECASALPIAIEQAPTNRSLPNIFGSEFGCVGMSSFESRMLNTGGP